MINDSYLSLKFYARRIRFAAYCAIVALQVTEVPKMVEENRLSFKLRRTSFLRDSNFNYNNNDVVDV